MCEVVVERWRGCGLSHGDAGRLADKSRIAIRYGEHDVEYKANET